MKRTPVVVGAVIVLAGSIVLSFVAGRMTGRSVEGTKAASRRVLYWVDPMHPAYKSDKPGIAPDCGMALEPVYEGENGSPEASLPPGAISLSSERQQLIGIRMGIVSKSSGSQTVRTTGRVVPDDNHLYKVLAGADGWIESLEENPPGTLVKKGQELAKMYSSDFRTAEAAYLGFAAGVVRLRQNMNPSEMKSIEDSSHINEEQLRLFGVGDDQLKQLRETLRPTGIINLVSPGDGIVLARGISPRQRFEKGAELYRIADLSKVWIVADMHGDDGEVRPGTRVKVRVPELGKTIMATVGSSTPLFDDAARTLKLRLEADNPGLLLRPDMFVDVEFEAKIPSGISIPSDAVLDSGMRKIVYVEKNDGVFEPRPVEISGTFGDRVMIARGLDEGERIVVSGNFLLDSESRMRLTGSQVPESEPEGKAGAHLTAKGAAHADSVHDPVCGMTLKTNEVKFTESYRGKTFHFCSDSCRKKFLADPGKYAGATVANDGMTKDRAAGSHD
jgi:RND family efflux transporter MFP subunit